MMNNSKIKTQLLDLIRQTKSEISTLCEYPSPFVSKDKGTKVNEFLARFEKGLEDAPIADTEKSLALAKAIREQLASIRCDIPGADMPPHLEEALLALGDSIEELANVPKGGRKFFFFKPKLEPFVAGGEDAFREGKADELTAAVYILGRFSISEEIWEESGVITKPQEMPKPPRPFIPETDPEYLAFQLEIDDCSANAERARQSGDMELSQSYLEAKERHTKARDAYLAGKQEEMTKALADFREAMVASKRTNPHEKIIEQFKGVSELLTANGGVSYIDRAKAVAVVGGFTLGELLRGYIKAAMDGDKDTMDEIFGLLINIKQSCEAC